MTDRKGRLQEDECMQSTESSGASLSLEHIEPGLLRTAPNTESSKPSTSTKGGIDMSILDSFLIESANDAGGEPYLEILEQPKQKDLRFRYECEGRSAGSLLGVNSNSDRKTYPTVKIKNYTGKAKVVACLVTRQTPHQLHPNGLVGKFCKNGISTVTTDSNQRMTASFPHLGIQCAKKKDIQSAVKERQRLGVDPFNQAVARADSQQPDYEMNVVCLCFQAFLPDPRIPQQFSRALTPMVSHPIYDKKGASLNISRCDRNCGSVSGGDEMFILCDKVQKDDIEVVFFHGEWETNASFGPSDIHRQVAIVCKTPSYKEKNIQEPITVQFKLRRKSDRETSDPVDFIYKPIDLDADGVEAKRRKKSPHFSKFFRESAPVKQEPVDTSMLQQQQQQQQQHFRQIGSPNVATASGDPNVKRILRNKLEHNSTKQPIVKAFNADLSPDGRHPPREYARAVRSAQPDNNPRIAKFSPDSSTFSFSDRSNMSFGTVIQRDSTAPGTPAAGAPAAGAPAPSAPAVASFAMPQPQVPPVHCNPTTLPFQGVPTETMVYQQLPPDPAMTDMASPANFGQNIAAQVFPTDSTGTEGTESYLTNEEQLLQQITGDFFEEGNLAQFLDLTTLDSSEDLQDFTSLQAFDPRTLSLRPDMADGMESEFSVENVTDSVSIPYSHSVELEHDPNTHNCDQNG